MAKYKIAVIPLTTIESKAQPFDLNKFLGIEGLCIIYFDYIKPVSSFYILYEEVKENYGGNDEQVSGFEEWAKRHQPIMPQPIPIWYDNDGNEPRKYEVGDIPFGPQPTVECSTVDSPEHLPNAERDLFDAAAVASELQRTIAEKYNGIDGRNGNLNG